MHFSVLDYALWAAESLGTAVLTSILIFRHRWREFPVFTALNGFYLAESIVLYAIILGGSRIWYNRAYYFIDYLTIAFEIGVMWEVARIVLRPTSTWILDARKQLLLWGAAGTLLSAALTELIVSPAPDLLRVWDTRSGLFTSILLCELVTVLLLGANRLGLSGSNHVMALAYGWGSLGAIFIVINAMHGYLGMRRSYIALDQAGQFVFLIVYVYWIVQFWREEPARKPISPELLSYIHALHEQVKKTLTR